MVGGFHRDSRGTMNPCARTYFSGRLRFGTSYEVVGKSKLRRNCDVCLRTKMTRAPCRTRTGEALPRAEKFGDLITADHNVLNEEGESRNNHRYAVVVHDLATQWIHSYPCRTENFSGIGKEFKKVSRTVTKTKSHLHRQFIRILQIL